MHENRDPAIKLFGMEIPVSSGDGKADSGGEVVPAEVDTDDESEKEPVMKKVNQIAQQDDTETSRDEEATNSEAPPESNANPKTPSIQEESSKSKVSDPEKDSNEANTSQEKTLKKPDKILPCPRCNSMDTKFCYYNNYNVNQPRHFCKACQRYWTAGGTMRNVPVGAGRRKSKNSASSNYRHITISEALQAAQIDVPDKSTHPAFTSNGAVLNFGYDAPICESMASMLNLADNKVLNGTSNGFHNFHGVPIPGRGGENGDNGSNGSSVTVSNSMEGGKNPQEPVVRNINGFPAQMPPLSGPGILWPYPWTPALPPPVFCPPGYPMPFHPAAYWNCSVPTPWNPSWLSPQSPSNQQCPISGPGSPLGKHSRDGKMLKPDGSEEEEQPQPKSTNARVLVPKTLRIDDPAEAAKSSIWETLGIENESISGGRMFKGFQSKKDEKNNAAKPSPVLLANPAALSRSLNFQEGI